MGKRSRMKAAARAAGRKLQSKPEPAGGKCDECGRTMKDSERCGRCRKGGLWFCASCHDSLDQVAKAFEVEYREPFDPPSPACEQCSSPISRETGFVLMGDTGECRCCPCIRVPDRVFAILSLKKT